MTKNASIIPRTSLDSIASQPPNRHYHNPKKQSHTLGAIWKGNRRDYNLATRGGQREGGREREREKQRGRTGVERYLLYVCAFKRGIIPSTI